MLNFFKLYDPFCNLLHLFIFFYNFKCVILCKCFSNRKSDLYSAITDDDLDTLVMEIKRAHPNAGNKIMLAYVGSRGIKIQSKNSCVRVKKII